MTWGGLHGQAVQRQFCEAIGAVNPRLDLGVHGGAQAVLREASR